MEKAREYPERDEYVICTITRLNPNSAFADLDEYNKQGMIHISEVSSSWIRDIRKKLKVGQKTVAKVLNVDVSRRIINLSLKRVKQHVKREKTLEWKNEKKAENLLKFVAKEMKSDLDNAYKKVGFPFQDKFGLMYLGFELAALEGKDALIKEGMDKKWVDAIEKIARKNIKPKEVSIKATILIKSFDSNGVEIIRKALDIKGPNVEIKYISAPKYSIKVKGKDFPSCEKILEGVSKEIIDAINKSNGEIELIRE
jgi:translation initiation factor 2 subunit 1